MMICHANTEKVPDFYWVEYMFSEDEYEDFIYWGSVNIDLQFGYIL